MVADVKTRFKGHKDRINRNSNRHFNKNEVCVNDIIPIKRKFNTWKYPSGDYYELREWLVMEQVLTKFLRIIEIIGIEVRTACKYTVKNHLQSSLCKIYPI